MKISDIAEVINETVKEPSKSGIDVFVGLEHYDIAEPVIKRFGSTQMLSTAAKVFKKGDVLIARRNVYLQRAAMAPFSGLTSGDSIVLRVKDNFDTKETDYETMSKLLPFILNSIDFWDYANTNADGTMSKRLSPALLLDYEFDLPSIEEQKLRAEKLWAAYEVKQSYLKMIKATQEMVQSQFIEMFGDKKNGSILTVGEISSMLFAGGDKPKDISLCKTEEYKYPVWSNGIGENGLMGFCRTYQVDKKSLTISARGTIGYCSIREPCFTPVVRLIVIIPNEKIELTYLKYFFENTGFEKTGAVQGQLTIPVLKEKKVYVPSIELQKKFVSIVHQADKSEFELKKSIEAIDAVIKSLINS